MKYEAIIFDLDGTLTDTLGDLTNSVNFALRQFGFPERTHEEVKSFVGNGVRRLIYLSVPENTDEETSERCLSVFKEYYKNNSLVETKPYNGIIPMLESLKKQEIKTAVVTNKMHEAAKEIVRIFFGNLIDITLGQETELHRSLNLTEYIMFLKSSVFQKKKQSMSVIPKWIA